MSKVKKKNNGNNLIRHHHRHHSHMLSSWCVGRTIRCFLLALIWLATTQWDIRANSSHPTTFRRNNQGLKDIDNTGEKSGTWRQLFLIGRNLGSSKTLKDQSMVSRYNHNSKLGACSLVSDNTITHDSQIRTMKRKIPIPWPINIIQERWNSRRESPSQVTIEKNPISDSRTSRSSSYPSMGILFLAYAKQQARIGLRQVSEISAQVWYNLPPSAPPLFLLASIPRNVRVFEGRNIAGATSSDSLRRIIPAFSDPFARSIVLCGLGMAVISWSNQELQRKKKLTPLALSAMRSDQGVEGGGRVSRVFLPPFLPEDVPEPEIDALLGTTTGESSHDNARRDELETNELEESTLSHVSPKIRRHLSSIYETTTATSKMFFRNYYNDWLQGRAVRKREVAKIRRNRIFDELVALQALKKRKISSRKKAEANYQAPESGYALVTGASRGIGRAIAAELARWEIPLVLVARDTSKLLKLASDLEACYGVRCCILRADLSEADAAETIYQATTEAGISIDILINNAGVASEGLAIDTETSFVEQMVMLNSLTYAKLSVLYGQDMKKKRRGRILMVSSMAGLCSASPNTAIYGACKAFDKSLALSLAKEMENYGVGVTCLMPGAVSETNFRVNSGTRNALCWYLPFYPRAPDIVAHQGVVSLLDGDTQSIPGWQNRAFANIIRPIIPQRLEIMLVQLAFSPIRIPSLRNLLERKKMNMLNDEVESPATFESPILAADDGPSRLSFKPQYEAKPPPRILKMPKDEPKEVDNVSKESTDGDVINEEISLPLPIMAKDANLTKDESYEDMIKIDPKDTPRSKTTLNSSNTNERATNEGKINEFKLKSTDCQFEASGVQDKDQLSDKNGNILDDGNVHTEKRKAKLEMESFRMKDTRIPSKDANKGDRDKREKPSRTHSKHNNSKISEGNRIERVQMPRWFDSDDDDIFSTKLEIFTIKD